MQLLESLQEIHPDKLPGVLEQYLHDGEHNAVRQALPTLMHQHPELHDQLQPMLERLRHHAGEADGNDAAHEPAARIETITGEHAQVFACGNCGGTVSKQHPDSNHVICHFCGCDALHPPADGLARWRQLLDARSRFTIGSLFNYEGRQWQVIGVQCYTGTLREWDSEDAVWESNRQNYTLWWLLNQERELTWVSDYGKSRYWSQKFIPHGPRLPASDDRNIEHGDWTLAFAAGEFSYMPADGEQRRSLEFTKSPKGLDAPDINSGSYSYSVEVGMDEQGEPEEIEFIRSRPLSNMQVLAGMGSAQLLEGVKRWAGTSNVFFGTIAAVALSYGLLSMLFSSQDVLSGGTEAGTTTPITIGELTVADSGENYSVELSSSRFAANRYAEAALDIEDSDGEWVGGVEVEFWRETGRDSDGNWDESRYRITQRFNFDHPGTYKLTLTPGETNLDTVPKFRAEVSSHPNPMKPFLFAAIASVAFAFLSRMRSRSRAASGASITAQLRPNPASSSATKRASS